MPDHTGPTEPRRPGPNQCKSPLNYPFDTCFLSGTPPDSEPDEDDSESSNSVTESTRMAYSATSLRVLSDCMLRMELTELEMIKRREAARLEAENQRAELETELTQMMLKTHLEIASFLSKKQLNRKRKRSDDDNPIASERGRAVLLSLLQCNLVSSCFYF